MRVAVVFFAARETSPVVSYARALAKGIEAEGHQVDVIDGIREQNKKITIYQYVALGTEKVSFFGKISEQIAVFLASMGTLQGKKAFAFVSKSVIFAPRALTRLMTAMEKEGMLIKFSEILESEENAFDIGKRLHINK